MPAKGLTMKSKEPTNELKTSISNLKENQKFDYINALTIT
jgi:hypothetical protein